MFLFDFESLISWGSLFGFLAGIFFGITTCGLFYIFLILQSMNKNRYLVKVQDYDIDGKEIELLVKQTQENFKDKKMRGEEGMVSYCYKLSKEMVIEIAKKFFPESKHPLMEISIDEALLLSTYVTKRLEELLDHKGLRLFRKLKISTIYGWTEVKTAIDENAIVKTTKKYKITQKFKAAMGIMNIVNPVYWAKKVLVKKTTDILLKKICIITIGIVGEETYKIYSKRVFNEEMYIDTGVEGFLSELKDDLDKEYENEKQSLDEEMDGEE